MAKSQWPLSSIKQQGIYSRKRSTTTTFLENIFWHAISKLQWLCVWSSWSKHRDQTMSQVVAYTEKEVKNIGQIMKPSSKKWLGHFHEEVVYQRFQQDLLYIMLCNDQWWVIYRYLTIQVFWHWLIIQGMLHNFALHHYHYHHHRHINIIRLSS